MKFSRRFLFLIIMAITTRSQRENGGKSRSNGKQRETDGIFTLDESISIFCFLFPMNKLIRPIFNIMADPSSCLKTSPSVPT